MPRNLQITLAILAVAVIIGLISLRSLQNRMTRLAETQTTEEQARRELLKPQLTSSSDVVSQTNIFWAAGPDHIEPSQVALPLSADPAKRARQVIDALILQTPSPDQRTLPADATLLGFYILPDGTAVADFSDALSTGTPSGIISEMQAIDSIARTLESNVSGLRRLKILIHGQEADTLAGHVDLTGFFELNSGGSSTAPAAQAIPNAASPLPAARSNSSPVPPSPHR
jgi:Sporulation and spore germination